MGIRNIINHSIKLITLTYVGSVFTCMMLSVGSDNQNYFWAAFSPLNWLMFITSGGSSYHILGLFFAFFVSFDHLIRIKVDYWYGSWCFN